MIDRIKKLLKKRLEGISDYISALICIVMMFVVFMVCIYAYHSVLAQNEIERINRKYLLSMEREGYLTSTYEAALINDLTAMGATSIVLDGTSRTAVGYGNTVVLKIECDIPVYSIDSNLHKAGGMKHVVVEREGTALY